MARMHRKANQPGATVSQPASPAATEKPIQVIGQQTGQDVAPVSWKPSAPKFASLEEINSRIQYATPEVTREVFDGVKGLLDAEQRRTPAVDARAMSLLGAAGLSMTVTFTFGAELVRSELGLNGIVSLLVVVIYLLALVTGLSAAFFSLLALFVRDDHPIADEDAVFRSEAFRLRGQESDGVYLKLLSVSFWAIYQLLVRKHVRKALYMRKAQYCFLVFLLLVGSLGGVIAMSSAKKSSQSMPVQNPTTRQNTSSSVPDASSTSNVLRPIGAKLVTDGQNPKR
jgi:hypothetical protein